MQQLCSRKSGVEIPTSIKEVVENAIYINNSGFDQHRVQLICDFADIPEVNIDRQKVLQILVNLVSNAKYSLIHSGNEEKILNIKFYQYNHDRLRIEVSDNGMGIEEENLIKIFRHGFTTKKTGNGFGLHSGALAAKEMAGECRQDGMVLKRSSESGRLTLKYKFVYARPILIIPGTI